MSEPSPRLRWLYLAAPLPALILGVLAMRRAGLPPMIWGQNLVAGLVLVAVCALVPTRMFLRRGPAWQNAIVLGSLGLLVATFLDPGLTGVHRWVTAGFLRLQASAVCLPALILALGATRQDASDRSHRAPLLLLGGAAGLVLLVMQPDATQATAFAGAWLTLSFGRRSSRLALLGLSLFAVAAVALAWQRPDSLLPVRHVEGIVSLAAQNGTSWRAAALSALAILPTPFLGFAWRDRSPTAWALGVYFCLCLLGSALGAFPVPVMGFGVSPMIGYFTALGWLGAGANRAED